MTAPALLLDTAEEVARWLRVSHGVTVRQIHQWARRGRIKRYPGGLYSMTEVADYLDGRSAIDTNRARLLAERHRRLTP